MGIFSTLPETVQQEIEVLAQRYQKPLVRLVEMNSKGNFEPVNKKDRYGEVCMVVRRPDGRLITMVKTYYPQDAYRLLTGGINHGETILDALVRETEEETGLHVEIKRFLTAVAYQLPALGPDPVFFTFAFLLDETGGTLGAIDEHEQVGDFRAISINELPILAQHLDQLGTTSGDKKWEDWGRFRSIIHTLVWESLQHPA